jgi:hypothetical protein
MQPDENDIVYTSYGIDPFVLIEKIYEAFFVGSDFTFASLLTTLANIWTLYSIIALALSALFIAGIIYSYIRSGQIGDEIAKRIADQERMWRELNNGSIENTRWQSVQTHLSSENPNDWKLAIIEADVLLERMLDKAGYSGATIGEKLKGASSRAFATLDDAWDAHRVRNQIAHGGSDFILTQRITKETLIKYERVFREFSFI